MSLCPDAHEQNLIHFSLRVPDSSQTAGGEKYRLGQAKEFCGAIEVSGDKCSADLSRGRQKAARASIPSNALENSLTLRSVALHLPIVASPYVPEQRLL